MMFGDTLANPELLSTTSFFSLPPELLVEILGYLDLEMMLYSQPVCKRWHDLVRNIVWRKKAGIMFNTIFEFRAEIPWYAYYLMNKMSFGRNLASNHPAVEGQIYTDTMTVKCSEDWRVVYSPTPDPELPDDPIFKEQPYCFVFNDSTPNGFKFQNISLPNLGYPTRFMDATQPPIEASVWFKCKEGSYYKFAVYLGTDQGFVTNGNFKFEITDEYYSNRSRNQWYKIQHVFRNYGPNVDRIWFENNGYNGSKCAGACVKILKPEYLPVNFVDLFVE